ncbi:hypothetical protein M8J71_17125 [Pseudarthrobacter sp. R1]|jgi:hypothetical protein|uniref:hypothetical protein n=1 Tax=Pseudarthrobacter sp. R1 TaxID=2944934 RepID=UPI00210E43B1|nr:hypothetical protein [Pseudarthrobacter sp. R1]MCQ6272188.1 hypothetical protein [Pseudarthrobacter sp. R1]
MSAASSEHRFVPTPRSSSPAKPAQKKTSPAEHRVQVAAARLRVTLDQRLGRETPAKTKALAKEPI